MNDLKRMHVSMIIGFQEWKILPKIVIF